MRNNMTQNRPVFTLGADPEMFVQQSLPGEQSSIISIHGLIPGDKRNPFPVNGGAIQVDGMAAEINVNPARTRQEFMDNIRTVMDELQGHLPPFTQIVHGLPVADFSADYMAMQPPEAVELGCEPDYNAWTGAVNPRPNGTALFRTASGHIHLGWDANVDNPYQDKEHFELCCRIAKQMDYYVGIYSLLWDPDNRRRDLYGKAGAFRAKSYGLEYRTPSTAWLAKPELQAWVFDASMKALTDYFNGDVAEDLFGDAAQSIINNNDTDWQKKVDFDLDLVLPYQQAA